jgi:hypothetical protein
VGRAVRRLGRARHGDVLLRGADHAGDHGAFGRRRSRAPRSDLRACRVADHARDHRRVIRAPAAWHGASRRPLRPDHGPMVRNASSARRGRDLASTAGASRGIAQLRRESARDTPGCGADDLGRRVPRADGRGSVVCRHGPLRQGAGALRMARLRVAGAAPELFRPGGVASDGRGPYRCCRRCSC